MRMRFIFLALVILTIGWKTCVQANRTNNTGNSLYMTSRNHKNNTNNNHELTNQIGWRNNITSYSSPNSRNSTTRIGNRSHNSRNNNHIHNARNNTTRATAPNRNSTLPSRNSTHLNHGHTNTTKVILPNRSSPPPGRNSTHINHGHTNSTWVSPSNRGSTPTISNNHTVPPPVVIYVPITSRKPKNKENSLTEAFLDVLQKELSKNKTTTTTSHKPKTTAKPITKTKQKIVHRPPTTTKVPITTTPPTPYPSTPITPFRNTSSPVQNQSPQVLYLPGGPYGYYVCNPTYPSGTAFPLINNGTTGSYVQPGIPAPQQGAGRVQPNPFNNPQNFGNGQLGTQQGIGQFGAIPQGTSGSFIQPGPIPQGFVNGQPVNYELYVQPGLVTTSQGPGYGQYPATVNPQNIGSDLATSQAPGYGQYPSNNNQQNNGNGQYVWHPSGAMPQGLPGSYIQTSQTPSYFNNGQPGSNVFPAHSSSTNGTQEPGNTQPPVYTTPQYYGNSQPVNTGFFVQPGLQTTSQAPGYVQYPTNTNQQNNGNGQYVGNSPSAMPPGLPGSYIQTSQTPPGFSNGQPGTPVSPAHSNSTNATQAPGNAQSLVYSTPQYYGNGPPGLATTSQGPGYAQYPANTNHENIGNGQLGTYGSYVGYPKVFSQGLPGSYIQTSQTPQNFSNGQPGTPMSTAHSDSTNATKEPGQMQPLAYTIPQYNGNSQPINTGFYVQPGLQTTSQVSGYVQYPANTNQPNIGNGQLGTYGSYAGQSGVMPQGLPGSYIQTSQTSQGFNNGQPGNPVFSGYASQEPGIIQPTGYIKPQNYGNGQSATNGSYVSNQQGFGQHNLFGSYGQPGQFGAVGSHFQTDNFSSNFQPAPTIYSQGFAPGQPGIPVTNTYPGPVNGLPIAPGTPQPYIYGPQGQICTFVYNQPGIAGIPQGFLPQPYPVSAWQGFPKSQPGSYGVFPTGANNSSAHQYQSYPVWPNSAYPNVQPSTFNASKGINSAPQTNTTSSGFPGTNY